jgi:antitoxin MazE
MEVSIISIGNSIGIRIPKSILQQLNIHEKVELLVHNKEILIKPIYEKPREGWSDKFIKMHTNGDDMLLISDIENQDSFEWEW